MIMRHGMPLGWWMAADMIPQTSHYVSVGSRRYMEWQTLAFEATVGSKGGIARSGYRTISGSPTISYTNEDFRPTKSGCRRESHDNQRGLYLNQKEKVRLMRFYQKYRLRSQQLTERLFENRIADRGLGSDFT